MEIKCQVCKKNFPEEFGGNLCPRCEDMRSEAREMQKEMEVYDGE